MGRTAKVRSGRGIRLFFATSSRAEAATLVVAEVTQRPLISKLAKEAQGLAH